MDKISDEGFLNYSPLTQTYYEISKMLRFLSKEKLGSILHATTIDVNDHNKPGYFLYGKYQSAITVYSNDCKITFKTHFNITSSKSLIHKPKNENKDDMIVNKVRDFYSEYTNLVAGRICVFLNTVGIKAGVSIPITTSGFDEIISSDERRSTSFDDFWNVSGENFHFTCTARLDVFNEERLKSFVFIQTQEPLGILMDFSEE
ncbi:MAG: hypothetical protein EOP48_00460 [Sphingobacteriales bacterium]|nr:MAG: hypothetical protein EOP48_00460 [Sphingobacteriales bacterium]